MRVDGQIARAYGNKDLKTHRTRDENDGQEGERDRDRSAHDRERSGYKSSPSTRRHEGGGGGGGLSNQMNRNIVVSTVHN